MEEGVYETHVTTGAVPGEYAVLAEARVVREFLWITDFEAAAIGGEIVLTKDNGILLASAVFGGTWGDHLTEVWGVEPRIQAIDPSPLVLNENSRTSRASFVRYEIAPEDYLARDAQVEIRVPALGDEVRARGVGTSRSAEGSTSKGKEGWRSTSPRKSPQKARIDLTKPNQINTVKINKQILGRFPRGCPPHPSPLPPSNLRIGLSASDLRIGRVCLF